MKIKYFSDIHTEFAPFNCEAVSGDVLLVAGDYGLGAKAWTYVDDFEILSENFNHVIYVLGNHEFYNSSLIRAREKIRENLLHLDNVHILEDEYVEIDGVRFIGSTCWTNLHDVIARISAKQYMNDYRIIRTGNAAFPYKRKITPEDLIAINKKSSDYIFSHITDKTVVITHHAPSTMSAAPQYRNDSLWLAYANEFEQLIDKHKPLAWVHGHMHTTSEYMLYDTLVLCNPRGYVPEHTNSYFNPNKEMALNV